MRPVFICPKALQAKSPVQKLRVLAYHNARVVSVDTNSGCIIVDILATTDSLYSNIFHSRRICIEQYHFLTRLSPGKHRLEVQSTDRYGRLVENTRYADIEVQPYWHETLFAKIIFVLLLVAAVWAVTYTCIYIRRDDRERRELLEKYMALMHHDADTSRDEVPAIACNHKPEVTALLDRVRQYTAENIGNAEASVDGMAAAAAVSRSTLNRHLRAALGVSASQLLSDARMQHAARLLRDPENAGMHIAEIADMCGYADHHYFRRVFTKKHGCTPAEYREG